VSKHNVEERERDVDIVWVYRQREGIKRVYLTDGIILRGTKEHVFT